MKTREKAKQRAYRVRNKGRSLFGELGLSGKESVVFSEQVTVLNTSFIQEVFCLCGRQRLLFHVIPITAMLRLHISIGVFQFYFFKKRCGLLLPAQELMISATTSYSDFMISFLSAFVQKARCDESPSLFLCKHYIVKGSSDVIGK